MKLVKDVILLSSLILVQFEVFSQVLNLEQKKIIGNEITTLLLKYQTLSALTEDNEKISTAYETRLLNLFTSDSAEVLNDIDAEGKLRKPVLTIYSYIENIKHLFPKGIAVQIHDQTIDWQIFEISKDQFYLYASAIKKLKGFYKGKKLYSSENHLFFMVSFTLLNNKNFGDFKILGIKDRPEKFRRQKVKGFYAGLNSNIFMGNLIYKDIVNNLKINTTGSFNYRINLEMCYFLSDYTGIMFGAGISNYQSKIELSDYSSSFKTKDLENEEYERRVTSPFVNEIQQLSFLDIPLGFKFIFKTSNKSGVYINLGSIVSFPLKTKFRGSGSFTYKGYYQSYNVELFNLSKYGFPSDINVTRNDKMETTSFNISGNSSLGLGFWLSKSLLLSMGGYFNMGLTNISKTYSNNYQLSNDAGDYSSLFNASKVSLMDYGLEINLLFQLSGK